MCLQIVLANIVKIIILVVCCQQGGRVDDSGLFPHAPQRSTIQAFLNNCPGRALGFSEETSTTQWGRGRRSSLVLPASSQPQASTAGGQEGAPQLERVPLAGKGYWGE